MNQSQLRDKMRCYQGPRYAELAQDVMVLSLLGDSSPGWFVEFGAMNGETASNSLLFERHHAWQGIVAEPALRFHAHLGINRHCRIDHRAVYSISDQILDFKEVDHHAGLSVLSEFIDSDHHAASRKSDHGPTYSVRSVSLNDLLTEHKAPYNIDYISMDTEGSELAILREFDFAKHDVKIWTIEHNFNQAHRSGIHSIMAANGYRRILEDQSRYDDWYVQTALIED